MAPLSRCVLAAGVLLCAPTAATALCCTAALIWSACMETECGKPSNSEPAQTLRLAGLVVELARACLHVPACVCLQAAILTGETHEHVQDLLLLDVTPLRCSSQPAAAASVVGACCEPSMQGQCGSACCPPMHAPRSSRHASCNLLYSPRPPLLPTLQPGPGDRGRRDDCAHPPQHHSAYQEGAGVLHLQRQPARGAHPGGWAAAASGGAVLCGCERASALAGRQAPTVATWGMPGGVVPQNRSHPPATAAPCCL